MAGVVSLLQIKCYQKLRPISVLKCTQHTESEFGCVKPASDAAQSAGDGLTH